MNEEFLSPKSDIIFKLLFGDERSIELLTDFLKSVLKLPADDYEEVTIVDPHLRPEYKGDKLGILDVKVKTKTKKTIDIEIQVLPTPELRERVVFYSAKMVTEQVGAGEDYSKIKRVISIIITDYALIPTSERYHNRYTLYDPETKSEFTDIIEVNTLELVKLPEVEDGTKLWEWMKFLSARSKEELNMIAERSPQVKKAVVRLMELSNDERTRLLYESRQKMEWDNRARERGASDSRALTIAKNMLRRNRPINEIIEDTGLTHTEVENLQNAGL
jgi:predicted transposase/invertase (TIGR01784 family)